MHELQISRQRLWLLTPLLVTASLAGPCPQWLPAQNAEAGAARTVVATTDTADEGSVKKAPGHRLRRPDTLLAVAIGPREIRIRWTQAAGATHYRLLRRRLVDPDWEDIAGQPLASTILAYLDRGMDILPGESYQYRLVALEQDEAGSTIAEVDTVVGIQAQLLSTAKSTDECYLEAMANKRSDCSHVMISALRSLAGEKSQSEWFSLQFKFNGNHIIPDERLPWTLRGVWRRVWGGPNRWFTLFYADINLEGRNEENGQGNGDSDDDGTSQQEFQAQRNGDEGPVNGEEDGLVSRRSFADLFNDATFSWNRWVGNPNDARRGTYAGVAAKVVDGIPYLGLQVGGMERIQSRFHGSYFAVMPLMLSVKDQAAADGNVRRDRRYSHIEFSLRGDEGPAFFQAFALRGGFLVPWKRAEEPTMRLVLLVPVGGVHPFR